MMQFQFQIINEETRLSIFLIANLNRKFIMFPRRFDKVIIERIRMRGIEFTFLFINICIGESYFDSFNKDDVKDFKEPELGLNFL